MVSIGAPEHEDDSVSAIVAAGIEQCRELCCRRVTAPFVQHNQPVTGLDATRQPLGLQAPNRLYIALEWRGLHESGIDTAPAAQTLGVVGDRRVGPVTSTLANGEDAKLQGVGQLNTGSSSSALASTSGTSRRGASRQSPSRS